MGMSVRRMGVLEERFVGLSRKEEEGEGACIMPTMRRSCKCMLSSNASILHARRRSSLVASALTLSTSSVAITPQRTLHAILPSRKLHASESLMKSSEGMRRSNWKGRAMKGTLSGPALALLAMFLVSRTEVAEAAISVIYRGCYDLSQATAGDAFSSSSMRLSTCVSLCSSSSTVIITPANSLFPFDPAISCYCTNNMLPSFDQIRPAYCNVDCVDGYTCGRAQGSGEPLVGSVYSVDRSSSEARSLIQPSASRSPSASLTQGLLAAPSSSADAAEAISSDSAASLTLEQINVATEPNEASTIRDLDASSTAAPGFATLVTAPIDLIPTSATSGIAPPPTNAPAKPSPNNGGDGSNDGTAGSKDAASAMADARDRFANLYPGPNPTSTAVLSAVAISIFIFLAAMGAVTFFRVFTSCGKRRKGGKNDAESSRRTSSSHRRSSSAGPLGQTGLGTFGRSRSHSSASAITVNSTTMLTSSAADMPLGSGGSGGGSPPGRGVIAPKILMPPPPALAFNAGHHGAWDPERATLDVASTSPLSSSLTSPASPISSALAGAGEVVYGTGAKRVRIVDPRGGN
ncbi:hypothetical protein BC829DRAFT_429956 [Chytridium lagenaria]|nr:hypothetical protein BC829DRAFT_429956 [Chytridium lagenaria]